MSDKDVNRVHTRYHRAPPLRDSKYHIYALYAQADLLEVQKILNFLRRHGYKIFDPLQDDTPGMWRFDSLLKNGMDRSRTFLVFLSKHFHRDKMKMFEAEQAIIAASSKRCIHRVINVMLKSCKIPRKLQQEQCVYAWRYREDAVKVHEHIIHALQAPHPRGRRKSVRHVWYAPGHKQKNPTDVSKLFVAFNLSKVLMVLKNSTISCVNDGCTFQTAGGDILRFHQHLKDCRFRFVQCENQKCRQTVQQKRFGRHLKNCPYRKILCQNKGCEVLLQQYLMKGHEFTCPYLEVDCQNKKFGCDHRFLRRDRDKHLEICQYVTVHCEDCNEPLLKSDMEMHLCAEAMLTCPICDHHIKRKYMEDHKSDCSKEVSCSNIGCERKMQKGELLQHEKYCPYVQYSCSNVGCRFQSTKSHMAAHEADCAYQRTTCTECGMSIVLKDLVVHRSECDSLVSCDKCGIKVPRSSKPTHDKWICTQRNFMSYCKSCMELKPYDEYQLHQDRHLRDSDDNVFSISDELEMGATGGDVNIKQRFNQALSFQISGGTGQSCIRSIPIQHSPSCTSNSDKEESSSLENESLSVISALAFSDQEEPQRGNRDQYSWSFTRVKISPESRSKLRRLHTFVDKNKHTIERQLSLKQ